MWIVRLALRRPYTFVVMSILIVIMGTLAILRTPTDIFPNINIPVVSIIWNYNGLVPEDMADRVVSITERALTTTVDNIEHIESQSLYRIAVVKVFLQPTANIQQGIAQITAVSQTQLRQLPAGTTPPLVLTYSASTVSVIQLTLSGKGLSEQVVNAISAQNLILPSGTSKIGPLEYDVNLNGAPKTIQELNDLPIKTVGSTT